MSFDTHPGHSASDCPLRMVVTAAFCGSSTNGYACSHTGGHCCPSGCCEARRASTFDDESANSDGIAAR